MKAHRGMIVGSAGVLALAAGVAVGGPLTPPPGVPTSTYKTLEQVEPRRAVTFENTPGNASALYRITQQGSYYLVGNIGVSGDTVAILIDSPDVTLDLNGFSVQRATAPAGTEPLIKSTSSNVVVMNGTVKSSGNDGVVLGSWSRVEDVRVVNALGDGIVLGAHGAVLRCTVENPAGAGIIVSSDSRVEDCMVRSAGDSGVITSTNSVVRNTRSWNNSQSGFSVAFGTMVEGCTATANTAFGIAAQLNAGSQRFVDNIATGNGAGGIRVYSTAIVKGNQVSSSGLAVPCISVLNDGCRIEGNLLFGGPDSVFIDAGGIDNLVINNQAFNPTSGNGFTNVNAANNMIGPVITAGGTIAGTNPFSNFSR